MNVALQSRQASGAIERIGDMEDKLEKFEDGIKNMSGSNGTGVDIAEIERMIGELKDKDQDKKIKECNGKIQELTKALREKVDANDFDSKLESIQE